MAWAWAWPWPWRGTEATLLLVDAVQPNAAMRVPGPRPALRLGRREKERGRPGCVEQDRGRGWGWQGEARRGRVGKGT